jgi:hypothetical protein
MPTYLVESYLPRAEWSTAAAVAALFGSRFDTRHRWSLLLPDEDLCLHVLDGPSAEVVREATERAELRCQRISQVVLLAAGHVELHGCQRMEREER